jgi:hypothetical protein
MTNHGTGERQWSVERAAHGATALQRCCVECEPSGTGQGQGPRVTPVFIYESPAERPATMSATRWFGIRLRLKKGSLQSGHWSSFALSIHSLMQS